MEEKSAPQGTTFLGHECNVEPQEKAWKEKKERVSASLSEPLALTKSLFSSPVTWPKTIRGHGGTSLMWQVQRRLGKNKVARRLWKNKCEDVGVRTLVWGVKVLFHLVGLRPSALLARASPCTLVRGLLPERFHLVQILRLMPWRWRSEYFSLNACLNSWVLPSLVTKIFEI